uniref:Uncharacterized protein n=1 Tax=Anguilla anguilla TaxID=7936 RepID=A0A0E9X0D8_ANGAN
MCTHFTHLLTYAFISKCSQELEIRNILHKKSHRHIHIQAIYATGLFTHRLLALTGQIQKQFTIHHVYVKSKLLKKNVQLN